MRSLKLIGFLLPVLLLGGTGCNSTARLVSALARDQNNFALRVASPTLTITIVRTGTNCPVLSP